MAISDKEVMVDIEALGASDEHNITQTDCVIISIGAKIFKQNGDVEKDDLPEMQVFLELDQPDRVAYPDTVAWWKEQDQEAIDSAFRKEGRVDIAKGLWALHDFLVDHKPRKFWANPPSYDEEILKHAFRQYEIPWPVNHWNVHNSRSIEAFFYGRNTRKVGEVNWIDDGSPKHEALFDCKLQIKMLQNCRRDLRATR